MTSDYADVLHTKTRLNHKLGIDIAPADVHPMLHEWQQRIVQWARRMGERWLILAPLSVARQTVKRTALLAVLALALTGCSLREVKEIRLKDGTRCAVTVNRLSGNQSEPHCDWEEQ